MPPASAASATGVGVSSPLRPDGRAGAVTTAARSTGRTPLAAAPARRSRVGRAKAPLPKNRLRTGAMGLRSGQGGHLPARHAAFILLGAGPPG